MNQNRKPIPFNPNSFAILFFTLLFFLCSADLVFSTRIEGLNFRWGQFLLLAAAIVSLVQVQVHKRSVAERWSLLNNWIPFFLIYALAVGFSSFPAPGFLKLGWALFNLGTAAWVLLEPGWGPAIRRGFRWAYAALAAFIILQAFCLFALPSLVTVTAADILPQRVSLTGHFLGLPFPLGIGQFSLKENGFFYRPCGFFYEPNYAGGAAALALPLLLQTEEEAGWGLIPGLVMAAAVLTSSRGGVLGCALVWAALFLASFWRPFSSQRRLLLKTLLPFLACLGLFLASSGGRWYLNHLVGPLGFQTIVANSSTPHTSEGDRVIAVHRGLGQILEHPWLGHGFQPTPGLTGLSAGTLNTWVEIGTESGILGLLAVLLALGATFRECLKKAYDPGALLFLATAWLVLFGLNWNLSSTFPRLDDWLLFFLSVSLALDRTRNQ